VRLLAEPPGCRSNYWLQTLLLDRALAAQRDAILEATNDAGFSTRPVWTLMHRLVPYQDYPRMPLPVAESLAARAINLPSSACLGSQ
jgi:dTDP-4-amino-4,6-dideoxygalactose transaminase